MYAEIGLNASTWITQPGASIWFSLAGSEKKMPDAYSQVRVTNVQMKYVRHEEHLESF